MKQAGDADSREDALAYIEAGSGETYLPEHAAAFVDTVNTAISNIADMTDIEWTYWKPGIDLVREPMSRAARTCSVAGFSLRARSSCSMDSKMSSTSVVVVEVTNARP